MTEALNRTESGRVESTRASILFNGKWTAEELRRIEDVVLAIDACRAPAAGPTLPGCAWICNAHEIRNVTYYMAHWNRRPGVVLSARSVEALAERMWQLAGGMPGHRS